MELNDTLYRAEVYDGHISYVEYLVTKVTPSGFWYAERGFDGERMIGSEPRWTSCGARRVCPTQAEALACLKARKLAYRRHCDRRLARCEDDLRTLFGDNVPTRKVPYGRSFSSVAVGFVL